MAIIDIILLICFIPAIVLGLTKGFVKQVVGMAGLIIGLWTASHFTAAVSSAISDKFDVSNELGMNILSFVLIFTVVALIVSLIGTILTKLLKGLSLGWINSLLGLLFALINTVLILGLVISVFEGLDASFSLLGEKARESLNSSVVYSRIQDIYSAVFPFIRDLLMNTGETVGEAASEMSEVANLL